MLTRTKGKGFVYLGEKPFGNVAIEVCTFRDDENDVQQAYTDVHQACTTDIARYEICLSPMPPVNSGRYTLRWAADGKQMMISFKVTSPGHAEIFQQPEMVATAGAANDIDAAPSTVRAWSNAKNARLTEASRAGL
jgi:hypothetical protein